MEGQRYGTDAMARYLVRVTVFFFFLLSCSRVPRLVVYRFTLVPGMIRVVSNKTSCNRYVGKAGIGKFALVKAKHPSQ